ncbi:MAG: cation:proton antiporter [Gammaproteobacteria bacterium]|nr:cation:proton antiporter [Gammaproteobacteria bacterium]
MPFFPDVFHEIAAVLALAAVVGVVGLLLRQPLIVTFIATGVLAGPAALGWVAATDQVDLLGSIGVTLLLFVVGLRLDLTLIRTMGPVAVYTGVGQIVFTSVIGYFLALALGMEPPTAIYVAVALTFSSTIIIVKLLSDKREIDALHGRIAVGFLIVQDLAVVLVMLALAGFEKGDDTAGHLVGAAQVIGKGVFGALVVGVVARLVLAPLTERLARSGELLVLFAVAWAVALAALSELLGFSKEVGAFVAGVALASNQYREAIGARLVGVRDFLLLFFFISLGSKLQLGQLAEQLVPATMLSLFVLIGNPLIVMVIMGVMGYRKRTGFLAGLTVAQISEFSLLFAGLGVSLGHIDSDALGLITLVGLVTIGVSTYMILYSHQLFDLLVPWLGLFERRVAFRESDAVTSDAQVAGLPEAIVVGLGRYGGTLAQALRQHGISPLGVDFDPVSVQRCRAAGIAAMYGDAEDPETAVRLPLQRARWVISTVVQPEITLALVHSLRDAGYRGRIAATVHDDEGARRLSRAGVDIIFEPFRDAGREAAARIHAAEHAGTEGKA